MFIREKTKKHKGQEYIQYQLVESYRIKSGPRQDVILNLGTDFKLPKEKWWTLIPAIERKLSNQIELEMAEKDVEMEALAEHYAKLIVAEKLNKETELKEKLKQKAEQKDLQLVDINSMANSDSRSIGAEQILVEEMKRFELDAILKEMEFSEKEVAEVKMLIAGRAVHPGSERETARWITDDSGIQELIGSDIKVYDTSLHRTGKKLWEKKEEIEKALTEKSRNLFSLKETIILYDLTNTYFEGEYKKATDITFGRSKERRSDCKLATLALMIDEEGFPKQSKILKGNISEPGTLKNFILEIKKMGKESEEKTIVIDAGIATEENIKLIKEEKIRYVAISRKRNYDESLWKDAEEKRIKVNKNKAELKLNLHRTEEESFLLCKSSDKEKRDEDIITTRLNRFENELQTIADALSKKKTMKRYDKVLERIGRIKERHGVGNLYDIGIKKDGETVTEIKFERNNKALAVVEGYGEYVIRTNRIDLKEEEISKIHRSLTNVEDAFRIMKAELGMRPNFHKNEIAAFTHIFITVIAYYFINSILFKLKDTGCNYTWNTVRNIVSTHDRVTTSFNNEKNETIYIRNTVTANRSQNEIYKFLGIKNTLNKKKYVHV